MSRSRVVLVGRVGCHLCDEARTVVAAVCDATGTSWTETDVDSADDLRRAFSDAVPVVLVDGHEVARYRVDARTLRAALR